MRRRFQLLTLAILCLTACDNPNEPRQRSGRPGGGPAALATSSALGTLGGTVYFSLYPSQSIWKVDPNGGSATAVTRGKLVRVAPGGQRLAVVREGPPQTLLVVDADGSNEHVLASGTFTIMALAWSPDGSQVAAYYDGTPAKIRIFNASDGSFVDLAPPGPPATEQALDWRGGKWAVTYHDQRTPPGGNSAETYGMVSTAPTSTGVFSDLFTVAWLTIGSGVWNPAPSVARIDGSDNVFWAGSNYSTNQFGIFNQSNTFRVNTGRTTDFAFSPNGDAIVAVRVTSSSSGSSYFLDVIDWLTGSYVRTLYTTDFAAIGGGNFILTADWSRPATTSAPIASIRYLGTGTANEFNFDGSGSVTTAQGATIQSYAWNFGDGSTASGATVVHAFQTSGEHVVTLKVTDSNGLEASTSVTLSAKLSIATVTPSSDALNVGDKFTFDVDVHNDGGVPISGVTPSVAITPPTIARIDSGPKPTSIDLAAGTHQHFTFYATALAAGSGNAVVDATGTAPSGPVSAQQRLRNLTVNGTGIGVQLVATPQIPDAGGQFAVTATLTNLGAADLVSIVGVLTTTPTAGVNLLGSTPASITRLTPGAKADLVWKVTSANPGPLIVSVLADGHEDNTGALERKGTGALTVTVADRRLVVTTTGDQLLDTQHLEDKICDVDPKTDGNQCTLRSAIKLANTIGDAQTITFDIPGGGVPTITPQSALPTITVPVTLDATTQPGGWVELSGAAAGNASGLVLDQGPSVIRGLVVNGWRQNGVWVRAAATSVIAGNRIGTNAAGTEARANFVGIEVDSPGARVGGTAGKSAAACAGDCNLIAGNTLQISPSTDGTGLAFGAGGGGAVQGNYFGTDVTGAVPLPNTSGITTAANSASVTVGGSTPAPGLAPGNVFGSHTFSALHLTTTGANHVVVGNLIGLDRSGKRALQPGSGSGIIFEAGNNVTLTVGGAAGYGNVIGGFDQGILVFGSASTVVHVEGNRIGTTTDGMSAVPNQAGTAIELADAENPENNPHIILIRNLVSGNARIGAEGVWEARGNLIGTDVTGTRALPNGSGIAGFLIGGIRAPGATSCVDPCNVISGNSSLGVSGTLVRGNFIGTDVSGSVAVPNGVEWTERPGISQGAAEGGTIGGASHAMAGSCDLSCNLISGNLEAGVGDAQIVAGNLIGLSINGSPLRNAGPGVYQSRGSDGSPRIVGGAGNLGNLITNSGDAGVVIGHSTDPVTVVGNSITGNKSGIRYLSDYTHTVPTTPVIDAALAVNAGAAISGYVPGLATSGSFTSPRIDLYASPSCESSPQGAIPLGNTTASVITGRWSIDISSVPASARVITATVTSEGATSSFSTCKSVTSGDPARPTITQAAPAGSDRVEVSSNAGFDVGGWARLNSGQTNAELKKIRAFGSLIFTSPLAFDHATGEAVEPAGPPPASGWLLSLIGELTPFGGAPTIAMPAATSPRTTPVSGGVATPTGRGLWILTPDGVVQPVGDAHFFGDARTQLVPGEAAISLLPSSLHGYLIVTSRGRIFAFGDATSLGAPTTSPSDRIVGAVLMPSRRGYLVISSCGAVFAFGETGNLNSSRSGLCHVVGGAIPNQGTGAWLLHSDGRVDALGGAPTFPQSTAVPNAVSIAPEGDGYVVADATGRMYAFGTPAPAAVATKAPVVSVIPIPR